MRLAHLRWTEPTGAFAVFGEPNAIWQAWQLVFLVRRASQTPEAFKFEICSIPHGTPLNPLHGAGLPPYKVDEKRGAWE